MNTLIKMKTLRYNNRTLSLNPLLRELHVVLLLLIESVASTLPGKMGTLGLCTIKNKACSVLYANNSTRSQKMEAGYGCVRGIRVSTTTR